MRKAGILCAISSLPSDHGIGDFGPNSYRFVDLIRQAGFKIWQLLPLNPVGYGNSPYQPDSSSAMDTAYISLDLLKEAGLIKKTKKFRATATETDFESVRAFKEPYFKEAFSNFTETPQYRQFTRFAWVYRYAAFRTFKKLNDGKEWSAWSLEQQRWIEDRTSFDLTPYQEEVKYEIFLQFILYQQWSNLKKYANRNGIKIIGDVPFYVGLDSEDVWSHQACFLLDEVKQPTFIAGVPPDYFSETGQRWGNPIYNWPYLCETNYDFWIHRLSYNSRIYDEIRIDHFRAFDTYWKIPAACPTAIEGEWVEAPGYAFFDTLFKEYPRMKIIAEDLGELREEVLTLRDHYHFKGMKIIQFTFNPYGEDGVQDRKQLIVYTGAHDNQTLKGWYSDQTTAFKKAARRYFHRNGMDYASIEDSFIVYSLRHKAEYCILPMQDILHQDDRCRMNVPGTIGGDNWKYKLKDFRAFEQRLDFLYQEIKKAKRV